METQLKIIKAGSLKSRDVFVHNGLTHMVYLIEIYETFIEIETSSKSTTLVLLKSSEPVILLGRV